MDYVSRSCDPPKMKIGGGVDAYVSRSYDLPKKENFDGLHKHFWGAFSEKITKKGNLMDYISRSYDLQKVKNGDCLYK